MDPIYIGREATVWQAAADEGGVNLPDSITEARAAHAAADAAVKALPRPEEPVDPVRLVDGGMDPKDALAEADRSHQVIAFWRAEHDVLVSARAFKAAALNRAVEDNLEALVLAARPTVTEIVEEARPLVPKLDRFARGGYAAEQIVAKATAAELRAYQNVMALQVRFAAIHKAYVGSYATPARVSRVGEVSHTPGVMGWSAMDLNPAHFYWAEVALVANPRCNGQALTRTGRPAPPSTSLLLIAAEPAEAGFRLATYSELRERAQMEWNTRRAADPKASLYGVGSY